MRSAVAGLLVVALLAGTSAGQEAGVELGPGVKVTGTTLELADLNAAIDAPGSDWSWTRSTEARPPLHQFFCRRSDGRLVFLLGVLDRSFAPLDQGAADEFFRGYAGSPQGKSLELRRVLCEPADVTLAPGSFRYEATAVVRDVPCRVLGYVAAAGRLYHVQWFAPEKPAADDVELLRRFVRSFRLLGPPPPSPARAANFTLVLVGAWLGMVLGLSLLGACVGLLGRRTRASLVTGGLGLAVLAAVFVVPAVLLGSSSSSSFEAGQAFGRALGSACCLGLVPFAGLAVGLRFAVKKAP